MATVEQKQVDSDEAGMRLDRWFKVHYPELAFGALQKLLRTGQVRVDGGRVKADTRLEGGQKLGRFLGAPIGADQTLAVHGSGSSSLAACMICYEKCKIKKSL